MEGFGTSPGDEQEGGDDEGGTYAPDELEDTVEVTVEQDRVRQRVDADAARQDVLDAMTRARALGAGQPQVQPLMHPGSHVQDPQRQSTPSAVATANRFGIGQRFLLPQPGGRGGPAPRQPGPQGGSGGSATRQPGPRGGGGTGSQVGGGTWPRGGRDARPGPQQDQPGGQQEDVHHPQEEVTEKPPSKKRKKTKKAAAEGPRTSEILLSKHWPEDYSVKQIDALKPETVMAIFLSQEKNRRAEGKKRSLPGRICHFQV